MHCSQLCLLFGFALVLSLAGCGADSGSAAPVAELDEIAQYLAENPDQDTELEEGDLEDEEELSR